MHCIVMLFVDIQGGAGLLVVIADSCKLYNVKYHQLNMYSKFGSGQSLSSRAHDKKSFLF